MGILFFITVVFGYFFLDESPKYLVNANKIEKAIRILKKITKINKRPPFNFKLTC